MTDARAPRPVVAVLPSHVADQIAAGEVIERPASVVKELVENSLDAGATHIEIDVRDGGRSSIRVSDDGIGMLREDAARALARHATSKIRDASDLVGVGTFGFRGEALPAIASVSAFTLETATDDGESTVVRVNGGTITGIAPGTRRRGTTVTVEELFGQVPARRKFLRAARTEWRAIADILTTLALLRSDVAFHVTNDGKKAMVLPAAATLRERVAAAWGANVAENFVSVDDVAGPIRVRGLVEKPDNVGTSGRRVWLSVNNRAVRDPGIVRAAEEAYRTTIPAGVRPSLVLAIDLPGTDVDVNVHPAKAEVRFRDRWELEHAITRAIRQALGAPETIPGYHWPRQPLPAHSSPAVAPPPLYPRPSTPAVIPPPLSPPQLSNPQLSNPQLSNPQLSPPQLSNPQLSNPQLSNPQLSNPLSSRPLSILQLRATWLLIQTDTGLLLIDQHSAHERILYERFLASLTSENQPSQRLLFPLTLHLTPSEADAFESNRDLFERLGFEIEGFGGDTLLVSAVPLPHPRFDAPQCLRDSLAVLAGDRQGSAHTRHERLAATVACKAAIKAGDTLSEPEMRALYNDLANTTLAPHDVHGRATIIQISWDELERRFGR